MNTAVNTLPVTHDVPAIVEERSFWMRVGRTLRAVFEVPVPTEAVVKTSAQSLGSQSNKLMTISSARAIVVGAPAPTSTPIAALAVSARRPGLQGRWKGSHRVVIHLAD